MRGDSLQNNYRKGVASLVILSLLRREDMYGYQLVQETARVSGGLLTTQEGSLYPVLYRLVEQGYITDRKVLVGKRMTRVYYHLEPLGAEHLDSLIQDYTNVTTGVFRILRAGENSEENP
ncbi:MAG: PadR family transcriptional regulator [Candidatus Faecousia sp.]|nr:PadR family transcriptional regulator [Clostridiales bacterium]MDD7652698.1 PadR family transcriptional regulator [Bacillota bacterium]MDY4219597.1 PadR family transcriptional regulator [Candidatus Faecousia sp.]